MPPSARCRRSSASPWTAIPGRKRGTRSIAPLSASRPFRPVTATLADERSERNIATLLPQVQPLARALIESAAAIGIAIKIISGTRTYDEQNALYEQGRTKPGRIVTNARGGYSNHNFGIAFDIGVFEGGRYLDESPAYKAVGALGMKLGLEWGGNWKTIQDEPHFQLRPAWAREMSRARHACGTTSAQLAEASGVRCLALAHRPSRNFSNILLTVLSSRAY